MFENKTEAEARKEILDLVAEYADKFHNQKKEFHEGDRIPYASRVYDSREMVNLVDSSLEFWLTSGRYTDEFETELAEYLHVRILRPRKLRFLRKSDRIHDTYIPASRRAPCKAAGTRSSLLRQVSRPP